MSKEVKKFDSQPMNHKEVGKTPKSTALGIGALVFIVGGLVYLGVTHGKSMPLEVDSRAVKTDALEMVMAIKSTPSGTNAEAFMAKHKDVFSDSPPKGSAAIDKIVPAKDGKGFYELEVFTDDNTPSGQVYATIVKSKRLSDGAGFEGSITSTAEDGKPKWNIDAIYTESKDHERYLSLNHVVTADEETVLVREMHHVLLDAISGTPVVPRRVPHFVDGKS